jgi:CubicO group peptidase (beta-lactamase class C family)
MASLRFRGIAAFFLALGTASAAAAQPADFRAQADAIVRSAYPDDAPGAAVIITRHGRTLYSGSRGLADVEAGTPIGPTTVFKMGSLTKQFTAAVVLQLVQEGRISLDDPVSRFLADYRQPGASATVRQLLNHISGIQSYNDIPGWMIEANTNRAYSTGELIALFRDLPLRAAPGEAWAYSNSGYVLLAAIIETVTGEPWHRAVAERIGTPLALETIGYGEAREFSEAMARGYTADDGRVQPARLTHRSVPHAAAGLVGSVPDFARWTRALHKGRVVSPVLHAQMIAPATLTDGATRPYGFGLAFGEVRGRDVIRHDGRIAGFNAEGLYIPSEDVVVAVFANSDRPTTPPALVARRLAALALGKPFRRFVRVPADPQALSPYFGTYRMAGSGTSRQFLAREGKLYTVREGGQPSEVFAAGNDHFFFPGSDSWFRIRRVAGGSPVLEMHQDDGDAELGTRIGDIPPRPAGEAASGRPN